MKRQLKIIVAVFLTLSVCLWANAAVGTYTNGFYVVPDAYQYSVRLAWDHSLGTNVVGYHMYYGTNGPRQYTFHAKFGYTNQCTIEQLTGGRTYYFAATAEDDYGLQSDFSNEVAWITPSPLASPTNLTMLSATVQGSTNLTDWVTITNVPLIYVGTTNGTKFYRANLSLK
jgi:hypothetical protein